MKKTILTLAASTFMAGAIMISCKSPAEKVEQAQSNVVEANQDLSRANQEYLLDVESYRSEAADKIAANEESIKEFKLRIQNQKKAAKADYEKKIKELEQKNTDVKKKVDDYKAEGKEQWESFKAELSHDMDLIGKAFKDLTLVNNKPE